MPGNTDREERNPSRGERHDSILGDSHVLDSSQTDNNKDNMSRESIQREPEEEEKDELDEFGLPVPKIKVNSRPPSLYSDSFASARSSIDELREMEEPEDDRNADVEDNDVEETNGVSSPVEWPRLSRSTLPGTGHVKSSPFHALPTAKEAEKPTVYAERAKDLVKVSPVSNSIFKRQGSPIEQTSSRSVSFGAIPSESKEAPQNKPQEPRSQSEPPQPTFPAQEPPPEPQDPNPKDEKKEKLKDTVKIDISHSRNASATSPPLKSPPIFWDDAPTDNPTGASEWSHQLGVIQTLDHSPKNSRKSLEEDNWQSMPAYAAYDMYDEDGRLIAQQFADSDDEMAPEAVQGAGSGYTRMNQDEDAQSADSMDENTQYLFKESIDDEDAKTPLSQMQATKELLTEGQRIAYVGLCKLTMVAMLRDVGRVRFKEIRAAYESMTLWSQKMMIRLFGHMDISPDEQVMIEQLSEHGVIPSDLIPSLMANVEVSNPLVGSSSASDITSIASQQSVQSASSGTPPTSPSLPPPIMSPSALTSKKLNLDLRWTVLCDLFLVLIADSVYDARSRVLLERMGDHLGVEWIDITRFERRVTEALQIQEAGQQTWKEDSLIESRAKQARNRRYMMMGLATLGGGLVIGLSAGLLAPVIGAGLGAAFTTVGITGTTGFLAGTGGAALITTGGVVTGGSIAGKGMAKRTRNVSTFEFRPLHNNQRVNCLVTVSGWMSSKEDDVRLPFSTLDPVVGDVISLLWEPDTLTSMGQTMNILATEILTQSLQQVLGQTVLIALMSSIQWPMMLTKLSYLIDNPWSTSLDRAAACGLILADCLLHRNLGQRPISLAGFSLGSRVIYYCLLELAKQKAHGLVQDVYLFGTPVVIKQKECLKAQSVVAGRFVNGYKSNDWILGYLFRASTTELGRVAGLRPIENCGDIENLDCTEIVGGHLMYREFMPKLMKEAGFLVVSEEFTEMEDPDPDKHRERQIALYDEIEEAKKMVAQEEAEAMKAGKKVKKRSRKSGFLGLWGKEIDLKPQGFDESKRHSAGAQGSVPSGDYDPSRDLNEKSPRVSEAGSGKKGQEEDVLFDVDKMREELAANGLTVKSLESTLPPLVLSPPPSAPAMHRSSTTPAPLPAQQRTHTPSLPAMTKHNASTSRVHEEKAWTEPRDVTPRNQLAPLVLDTKRNLSTGWVVDSPKDAWDTKPDEPITMSFMPDSPQQSRAPTFQAAEALRPPSRPASSHSVEHKVEAKPISNVFSVPFERNVWDDDFQEGSGGNITLSFE